MQQVSNNIPDIRGDLDQWVTPKGFVEEYPNYFGLFASVRSMVWRNQGQ